MNAWLLLWACAAAPPAPVTPHGLEVVEAHTAGATAADSVPVVVMLHGLGANPEDFLQALRGWERPAHLVSVRAPQPWGQGFAWFELSVRTHGPDEIAPRLAEAAEQVARLLASLELPSCGKPVVTGFSQGGMLSFTLATHHAEQLAGAVPVAGWLPPPLWPGEEASVAPIRALHGEADDVLPLAATRQGVERLRQLGHDATLQTFPGVGHGVSRAMRAAWYAALDELACGG